MDFSDTSFWQSFVSNGLATLIGVIIGIPVALWISRYQERKTEKERKRKILLAIRAELEINKVDLIKWKKSLTGKPELLIYRTRTEAWKAFSDGGELDWIKDVDLLNILSGAFYMLNCVNYRSNLIFELRMTSFVSKEISMNTVERFFRDLCWTVDGRLEAIEQAISEINRIIEPEERILAS